MRKQLTSYSLILLALLAPGLMACGQPASGSTKKVTADSVFRGFPGIRVPTDSMYAILLQESRIGWKGEDITGGGHAGYLQLISGQVLKKPDGTLVNGDFVMDMNSITNTDQAEEGGRRSLEKHLKNDDFFATDKFPKGFFSITKIVPSPQANKFHITGDLTLKGIRHSISFPATIQVVNGRITARAETSINRTKWGINHQSGSIFKSLKDGIISDDIKISLDLVFVKPEGC